MHHYSFPFLLNRAEHDNIVKLVELFDCKGKLYLVMEL